MTEPAIGFNQAGYDEHKKIVREVTRRMMNEQPNRARWQQHRGGGGGETIWFEIDEVVCDSYGTEETYLLVTATWYTGGCSKTPPGAEYSGQYKVYDLCQFFSEHTATDLVGSVGKATYFYPLSGYCEPRWIVDMLCDTPECA